MAAENRKHRSKRLDEMEETPFTGPLNPRIKSQEAHLEKRKKPNCLRNTQCYFCDFCDNTSIHGFKFLGERGRYLLEKVWWFLVVVTAISGSAYLIQQTYTKWVTSPVVVTFAMTETPIWQIPFPAVTICPELKINKTVLNYTDVFLKNLFRNKTTEVEDKYYNMFSMVCDNYVPNSDNETDIFDDEELQYFYEGFAEMETKSCNWLGTSYDCDDILSDTLTSEGWCSTFNMLDYTDVYVDVEEFLENRAVKNTKAKMWSLENGYPEDAGLEDAFPRRTILAGWKGGFEVHLSVKEDDLDYICSDLQGFKVTLHHPSEEPDMDKHFRVPLNQAVIVAIRPRMITTAAEIKHYKPEERQCYLPNEKILSTFKIYTQQNCITECLTNYTLAMCGCVPFYRSYNGPDYKCGPGSKTCMEQAKAYFLEDDVLSKINKSAVSGIAEQCNCLPACTSLAFDSETSQTDWEWRKTFAFVQDIFKEEDVLLRFHNTKLIVYYKDMQFMTSERHELYGVVDFLANCGGLLGLFCGFSFTSSIEILYYLTLRFVCNLKKFGRRVWSGAPELIEEDERRKDGNQVIG